MIRNAFLRSSFLCLAALACSLFFSLTVEARSPLLQPGKQSVFQRVVTHPGAKLYQGAEEGSSELQSVRTFTVMYIYGRTGTRLEVGVSSRGPDGWIDQDKVTEWPQAITMLFTDRTGRAPVLFFRNLEALVSTCQSDNLSRDVRGYIEAMKSGKNTEGLPVIASEPVDSAVAEKNFYLLPVLNMDSRFSDLKLVEVASIDPGTGEEEKRGGRRPGEGDGPAELRMGFAFVIDTTISMGPYIRQTTELIHTLYNSLEKSPYADKIAFAVVAFRSNVAKTPGLEYTAKVICDFTTVKDRKRLERALAEVREASVSTHDINEDSFAGIREAAEKLSWDRYGSRVMLMVTDAGPLGAGDPTSRTGLSPEALADYLREKKIYLTCAHVLGKNTKNHAYAAKAYRTLTMQSDNQASYIAIEAGNHAQGAASFRNTAKTLAEAYSKILEATATGRFLSEPLQVQGNKKKSPEDEARRIAESTGYAMQLQFLGNRKRSAAPSVVKAWVADADLEKLDQSQGEAPVLACEPAVLLTKGQLNHLYAQLKLLLRAGEEAFLNGDTDLFAQIRSAAAQMSRDPKQFVLNPNRNLIENNLLDEVLQDLPYKSQVASMTQQDWESLSTGGRQEFISRIKALLARYEEYDRDATHWESFGSTNSDDWVYRVPLSMLP